MSYGVQNYEDSTKQYTCLCSTCKMNHSTCLNVYTLAQIRIKWALGPRFRCLRISKIGHLKYLSRGQWGDFNCFLLVDGPKTESVYILLSDTHYPDVTPTERHQMAVCVVLHAPVTMRIDLDRPCFPSARGRYLYVVLGRESEGKGRMLIYEMRAYSGKCVIVKPPNVIHLATISCHISNSWAHRPL